MKYTDAAQDIIMIKKKRLYFRMSDHREMEYCY